MEAAPAFVSTSVVTRLRQLSRASGLVVVVMGLLVLVGWAWDIAALKSVRLSWATMKANTAACFVLLGAALWICDSAADARHWTIARLLSATALIVAVLTLSQDVFGWHLGIDELLFIDRTSSNRPGRMAVATAVLIGLVGTAVIQFDRESLGRVTSQWLGLITAVAALISLCGYLYSVDALYEIPGFGSLSVYTATCLLLLGIGVLAAQPRGGLMLVLSANTLGGTLARRLLPMIVAAPVGLGWLSLRGQQRGWYDGAFGVALFAVSNVLVVGVVTWLAARRLVESEFTRRKVHDDLAENRRRLSTTLRSLSDAVIATDEQRRVTLMNPVAERLLGWSATEATGRRLDDVFSIISQGSGAPAESPVDLVLRERRIADHSDHLAVVARTGRTIPIASSAAPILRDDGNIEGVVLVFHDVTAERQADRALRHSQGLLQAISENSTAVIYAKDLEGRYLLVNRRFTDLFHVDAGQVLGKTDYQLFPFAEADGFRQMDQRVVAAGVALTDEERVVLDDGMHTFVSVKCPLVDEAGQVYAAFGISTDITDRKRAEEALRASEERTRLIIDSALDAVITIDTTGAVTGWSPQAEAVFGWRREDILGRSLSDTIIPERYRESHRRGLERFLATGQGPALNTRLELTALDRSGREFPIELAITPLRIGDSASFSAFVRDISERRRMEQDLVESRQHYQALAESLPHLVWTCRADGYCDFLSRQWVEYTGRPAEEQLGSGWAEQLHPDDRDRVQEEWAKATVRGDVFDVEFRIRRADGVYRWFKTRAVPLRDASGAVVKWFGSNTDFEDYKQAMDGLARAEEWFRLVVEASPNAMLVVDGARRIVMLNRRGEDLFGYGREEVLGQAVEMLVPASARHVHPELVQGFQRAPTTRPMGVGRELFGQRKDGSLVPVEIGLSPVELPAGRYTLASIIDVTERRRIEDDLRRSNADLEQFAYVASHDLQEPLRMVASYTELLARRYHGQLDERADTYIHYATDGAKRMQRLITDLLAFSRVGSRSADMQPVDSGRVLHVALTSLGAAMRQANASIEVLGELPVVQADEGQLAQVFQNLIGNAIKFKSEAPPHVVVGATLRDGRWVFSIKDNGIGMEMQYADRIFQMFQRLHERGLYEGSGIGLAITKRIVERHGGSVWFESQPGAGSTFFFTMLPATAGAGG